jgi:hypothetical protein
MEPETARSESGICLARAEEKRRWRAALQNLAAIRTRLVNEPGSWSAPYFARLGSARFPSVSQSLFLLFLLSARNVVPHLVA